MPTSIGCAPGRNQKFQSVTHRRISCVPFACCFVALNHAVLLPLRVPTAVRGVGIESVKSILPTSVNSAKYGATHVLPTAFITPRKRQPWRSAGTLPRMPCRLPMEYRSAVARSRHHAKQLACVYICDGSCQENKMMCQERQSREPPDPGHGTGPPTQIAMTRHGGWPPASAKRRAASRMPLVARRCADGCCALRSLARPPDRALPSRGRAPTRRPARARFASVQ
jgi:hypothetical protein